MTKNCRLRICIDRGGTFTDCIGFDSVSNKKFVVKLLSEDPQNYPDAPREGIRRILELATGTPHPRNVPLDTSQIESIRMGTTVATNALLERKGELTALLITKGFKNLLYIGNQARPNIFDLNIAHPDLLYQQVVEVEERVTLLDEQQLDHHHGQDNNISSLDGTLNIITGITEEKVCVLQSPDLYKIKKDLERLKERGIKSIAICLMHAFTFDTHEKQIAELAKTIGFDHVTMSSEIMPMIKIVPRGHSAVADAYLTPCIRKYLKGFFDGFDDGIRGNPEKNILPRVRVEFMQSDGGLANALDFSGFKAILSGPAGGVVGYALTSFEESVCQAVIGFDMGGTSTDVSRYAGAYEHVFETTTAGITIQAPQLDINTVAAGGGSRLFFKNGMFVVGPESAGANPGPACYKKGGRLAITDANLLLGRLIPDHFPKIFGLSEMEPLDFDATYNAFCTLKKQMVDEQALPESREKFESMSLEEIAYGFIQVANESMCRPIRALTQAKGLDTSRHLLACFGGAGGQHACAIAKNLGIKRILVHKYAAVLSAYGLSLADTVHEVQEPCAMLFTQENIAYFHEKISNMSEICKAALKKQGFSESTLRIEAYLNLRYQGTDTAMMIPKPLEDWSFPEKFEDRYKAEFGFSLTDRDIIVDDIRVRCLAKDFPSLTLNLSKEISSLERKETSPENHTKVYWGELKAKVDTPVFLLQKLSPGTLINGPALIIYNTSTIVIHPDCQALITNEHVVVDVIGKGSSNNELGIELDPIQLSIFAHRFMSIAEQMGRTLQKTAISTNIKERLDFSCALFGPDGGLVANAPHIPVHLGSMQEAVRWQMNYLKHDLKESDVLLTNHPMAGGSHLPDITVITPVFDNGKLVFFVASRGHHADIGGIQPGSMPPNSTELYQEGAAIKSFKLVTDGQFDEKGITRILFEEPAKYEGCSGTRALKDNISDLKAQVAANHRGIQLVKGLIKEYGLEIVQTYMYYIQQNAAQAVKDFLKRIGKEYGSILQAQDHMDDGSIIKLTITIQEEEGTATFDFNGTSLEVYGNTNAPTSVSHSAIIYCLRCLIALDIPLNQGALDPIKVVIPENSLLNPSEGSAVVGGNVLTSQRLCDVILKAFRACAASQGCCNNFTFGKGGKDEHGNPVTGFGYYETIAGGAGAGPTWNGRSGVHTHMTNTRITDPEILERRYPVILREFSLREGSGGGGLFKGGDGVVRELEFLTTLNVSMLSERRVYAPYGMSGGSPGLPGRNLLIRKKRKYGQGKIINFGGKNATIVYKGDRLRIETPGGGGWGALNGSIQKKETVKGEINVPYLKAGGSLQSYEETQNDF